MINHFLSRSIKNNFQNNDSLIVTILSLSTLFIDFVLSECRIQFQTAKEACSSPKDYGFHCIHLLVDGFVMLTLLHGCL